MAFFKTGLGITEELIRMAEIGRKNIEKYESQLANKEQKYQKSLFE